MLIGYNWPFDAAMLEAELGDAWREAIHSKPIIDALIVVRHVGRSWRGSGRHKLDNAVRTLCLHREGDAHRASSDAEMAFRVLWSCRHSLPTDVTEAVCQVESWRLGQEAERARGRGVGW